MTTTLNNNNKISVKLLGNIYNIFESICPLVNYAHQIKSDLQGRGVNKISNKIRTTATKFLAKRRKLLPTLRECLGEALTLPKKF